MQQYTSRNTSINSKKMPKIYTLVSGLINGNASVIDYGCGKYFDSYNPSFACVGYDPYNRPNKELLNNKYDYALCSNVLNVIKEPTERRKVLETLKKIANTTYITVYEGNGTGKGGVTKTDCYQLNRKRCDYIPELVEVFGKGNVRFIKGMFECKKGVA